MHLRHGTSLLYTYFEVPNKSVSVTFLILFFPTYLALLGPTRLFIFGKNSHLHCFLRDKYKKNPTYTALLRSTLLLLSEKTSHLQGY